MLKGMTTEYLVDHCAKPWLKKATSCCSMPPPRRRPLVRPVGQGRGYKAIGTVSSPEKAALAKKNGYKW